MKFVFVSNFLNHHQIPFSETLRSLVDEFYFVSTQSDQVQGYQVPSDAEYVVRYDSDDKCRAEELILSADVVIFGACPNELIEMRMRENKLSFLYTERFFKKGTWRRFIPRTRKKVTNRIIRYKDKNIFILCASGFVSHDVSLLGFPTEKCFKWGYFPKVESNTSCEKTENSILWAGRMLSWKRPEIALKVAKKLKVKGYRFKMTIAGDGPQKACVDRLIKKYALEDLVQTVGSKMHDELLSLMASTQIFLFTSDRYEGWGAVLNEAMGNGCAAVAGDAIGSAPFLITKGQNGSVFRSENATDAYKKVKYLLDHSDACRDMGRRAKKSIDELWNYRVAAERLVRLSKELLQGNREEIYTDGPCSKADKPKGRSL